MTCTIRTDQMSEARGAVTQLLEEWRGGDEAAVNELFPLVYRELRRLARGQRFRHRRNDSLVTTALVHEAYLKLVGAADKQYRNRGHFMAVAAKAMRQILVDQARKRSAQKRGGDLQRSDMDEERLPGAQRDEEVVALDEALTRLETRDPRMSRVVELRFFGGLSVEEAAESLEISPTTVKREWRKARAFLHRHVSDELAADA